MTQDTVTTVITRPIAVSVRSRRRRPRYTRGLRDFDRVSRGLARASYRLVAAVAEGMRTYLDERDKSARRRRDGALFDMPLNLADALGTTLSESRDVPRDLARSLDTPRRRRSTRRALRAFARMNRRAFRMR